MVSSKRINNIRDAVTLSDVIVKLEKNTSQWDITQKEKKSEKWHPSNCVQSGIPRVIPQVNFDCCPICSMRFSFTCLHD